MNGSIEIVRAILDMKWMSMSGWIQRWRSHRRPFQPRLPNFWTAIGRPLSMAWIRQMLRWRMYSDLFLNCRWIFSQVFCPEQSVLFSFFFLNGELLWWVYYIFCLMRIAMNYLWFQSSFPYGSNIESSYFNVPGYPSPALKLPQHNSDFTSLPPAVNLSHDHNRTGSQHDLLDGLETRRWVLLFLFYNVKWR